MKYLEQTVSSSENRMVGMMESCLLNIDFQFEMTKMFWIRVERGDHYTITSIFSLIRYIKNH